MADWRDVFSEEIFSQDNTLFPKEFDKVMSWVSTDILPEEKEKLWKFCSFLKKNPAAGLMEDMTYQTMCQEVKKIFANPVYKKAFEKGTAYIDALRELRTAQRMLENKRQKLAEIETRKNPERLVTKYTYKSSKSKADVFQYQLFLGNEQQYIPPKKNITEQLLDSSIDDLSISQRARNCLRRAHIDTLRQLLLLSEEELTAIKGMGLASYQQLCIGLYKDGLSVGMLRKEQERYAGAHT